MNESLCTTLNEFSDTSQKGDRPRVVKVVLRLDDALYKLVRLYCAQHGKTLSGLMRELIEAAHAGQHGAA